MKKSGLVIIIAVVIFCFLGPAFSPYSVNETNLEIANAGASFSNWLGTDRVGRDILTMLMVGGQVSLLVGVVVAILGSIIGAAVGILSGYYGGKIEKILMFVIDFALCIPILCVVLLLSSLAFDLGLSNFLRIVILILTLALFLWPTMARLIRSKTLIIKTDDHVVQAKLMGVSSKRIILKHILPKLKSYIISNASIMVGDAVLTESSLSFLGIGVGVLYPTWGSMISQATDFYIFKNYPTLWISSGFLIAITLISFHMMGVKHNDIA